MLRTQHNMTGQDSWYLQTSNCSGMWLPWLVLDQINILSRVSLVENSNYCSCSGQDRLKILLRSVLFLLEWSKKREYGTKVSTVHSVQVQDYFNVYSPDSSLLSPLCCNPLLPLYSGSGGARPGQTLSLTELTWTSGLWLSSLLSSEEHLSCSL